jgi:hypothetical protein
MGLFDSIRATLSCQMCGSSAEREIQTKRGPCLKLNLAVGDTIEPFFYGDYLDDWPETVSVLKGIDGRIAGLFGTRLGAPQTPKAAQPLMVTSAFTSPPFFGGLSSNPVGDAKFISGLTAASWTEFEFPK